MSINEVSERMAFAAQQLRSQARDYSETAIDRARKSALRAADRVAAVKRPIRVLADAGLRFTALSGRYVERVLGKQAGILEVVIDDGAGRLKSAARAENLRTLVQEQAEMTGNSRARLGKELRDSWGITKASGRDLRNLAVETYAEVMHGPKAAAPGAPKARTVRKRAAKSASRTAKRSRKSAH